mgnify:CR=1 FL=1
MKAVIYARVSTLEQDTERQLKELSALAKKDGYTIAHKPFEDKITGASKAKDRKGFDEMLQFIAANNITQIYCWELSRLGRSMIDIYQNIQELRTAGINVFIKKENINTAVNDANTQLQLNLLASLAEYERHGIKERTTSGTYNSVRNGGTGGGSIKQYGYKKQNGKLVIDEEEAGVILDICDKYLNKDWSVADIANYLNEVGIQTRYKKLIDAGTITYKVATDLLWTDGSVARLLHKKLLTGYRVYGPVELQDESLRIISIEMFDALQVKMDLKRKSKANSQKYEHILRGTLKCSHCGSSLVMSKSHNGLQNHYCCYRRFTLKDKSCDSAMINIDLLNNLVYQKTKDFVVTSADVQKRIDELISEIHKNSIKINQLNVEQTGLDRQELNLLDLYTMEKVKIANYEKKLKSLNDRSAEIKGTIAEIESANVSFNNQIKSLENKKIVDLTNPEIFKANARELIEKIEVKNISDSELIEIGEMLSDMQQEKVDLSDYERQHKGRDKNYYVTITMFDHNTRYEILVNNKQSYGDAIKVERINPQDKNKGILRKKVSKPVNHTFSL